jgi:lipopolysaccharide transport system permease protein
MSDENFELVIEAGRTERNYWRDLWRYRELFYLVSCRGCVVSGGGNRLLSENGKEFC